MTLKHLPTTELETLLTAYFIRHNTAKENARLVAQALVRAETDGKLGHGLSRAVGYAAQARSGKVNGMARPILSRPKTAAIHINASNGFAYPALALAVEHLPATAKAHGVAVAAVSHSHHCGVAGHAVETLATQGCMAFLFSNTPAAMAAWGGRRRVFGTNPIAFAAPVHNAPPLVIDMATTTTARGNIVKAQRDKQPIPRGWALDKNGAPTTDPDIALDGSMMPLGGAKGAALALMVETLTAALAGAAFSYEADSFFNADGAPPQVGQTLLALDAACFSAAATNRLASLLQQINDDGARVPGDNRHEWRRQAEKEGVPVSTDWLNEITASGE